MKFKASTYRKTVKTVGKVASYVPKVALAAAVYSNPALLGTVAAGLAAETALKGANRYFKGKNGPTARAFRSADDLARAGIQFSKGDYYGAALKGVKFVGDAGANKYFEGKNGRTARAYRSATDIANAGLMIKKGNYFGAAMQGSQLVTDSGALSSTAQRKYNSVNNNYIMPTLQTASTLKSANSQVKKFS